MNWNSSPRVFSYIESSKNIIAVLSHLPRRHLVGWPVFRIRRRVAPCGPRSLGIGCAHFGHLLWSAGLFSTLSFCDLTLPPVFLLLCALDLPLVAIMWTRISVAVYRHRTHSIHHRIVLRKKEMAWSQGGKVAPCDKREYGHAEVRFLKNQETHGQIDRLFEGLVSPFKVGPE